jgi:hypothetical protein
MFRLRLSFLISLATSATFSHAAQAPANKTAFVVATLGRVRNSSAVDTNSTSLKASSELKHITVNHEYPGTAVERMLAVRARVSELTDDDLNGRWEDVRRRLLWAGGLRDLVDAIPGQGYTGHAFNDYNHVDLTCMAEEIADNENDGSVREIAIGNRLGPGIRVASLPELGPGGSWSTCSIGCNVDPPQDVAHVQFRSRIAFKLVWVPNPKFDTFVLVDDDGKELAHGSPTEGLPSLRQREQNYYMVRGSKYAKVPDAIARSVATE